MEDLDDILNFIGGSKISVKKAKISKKVKSSLKNFKFNQDLSQLRASDILSIVYKDKIPIQPNPIEIADYFGIDVKEEYFDIQGLVQFFEERNRCVIKYKKFSFEGKNRFTIAHELGHIFLHFLRGESVKIEDRLISSGFDPLDNENQQNEEPLLSAARTFENKDDKMEKEANRFAGELLVPKIKIEKLFNNLKDGDKYSMRALHNHFNVSNGAMYYTLQNYNLWNLNKIEDDTKPF